MRGFLIANMNFRLTRICLLSVISGVVLSCDSRIDELDQFNDGPYFSLNSDTITSISDSLKLSQGNYVIAPSIMDANNNIVEILVSSTSGQGALLVNGTPVESSLAVNGNPTSLAYDPILDGLHNFTITAKDAFDLTADLEVSLTSFVNIPPTLIVEITQPAGAGPFERLIDASQSFDGDERFGGRITEYEYTFLHIIRNISESTQTVIFPSAGNYQVQVRVRDNDNVWTDLETIPIQIN